MRLDQNDYYAEDQDFQKCRYSEISQVGNTIEWLMEWKRISIHRKIITLIRDLKV